MKGKCFSKVNQGQRLEQDKYQTPLSMIDQFLQVRKFRERYTFLDPAAGKGSIVQVLKKYYKKVVSYDIQQGVDFFKETKKYNCIITNPPFRFANQFIEKAMEVCTDEFAFLMPLVYLHGKKRYDKFYNRDIPFQLSEVYVFTRMPMLTDQIIEYYDTGMQVYAWFVFSKLKTGGPFIKWIDNNKYVKRK